MSCFQDFRPGFGTIIRKAFVVIVLTISLLSISIIIFAQQKPSQKQEPAVKYTEVKYYADSSSYTWRGNDRILVLSGNVKFIQGDTTLTADRVEYHEESKTAAISGSIRVFDDRTSITGKSATIDFKNKLASLVGDVTMTIKPKPADSNGNSTSNQIRTDAVISCEKLQYDYKDKRAVVPGSVKIVQDSRIITADSASYSDKDDILELNGNVKVVDEQDKHNFTSPRVRISLKDGTQWIEAEKASGVFYIKEEEETQSTPSETKSP